MLWLIGSKILWLISENFVVYSTLLDEPLNMWWFAGLTCGGSLDEHMEDHWFEEWWLIG